MNLRFTFSGVLLISFLYGCTSYSCLRKSEVKNISISDFRPVFPTDSLSVLYNSKIRFFGNRFSGLTIIKKMPDHSHRFVFTTHFGMKIFDMELRNDTFNIIYVLEQINRPALLQTLEKNFRLMMMCNMYKQEVKEYKNEKFHSVKLKNMDGTTAYVSNTKSGKVVKAINKKGLCGKSIIRIPAYKENIPQIIHVINRGKFLRFDFELVER